jgi:hypothetical protein
MDDEEGPEEMWEGTLVISVEEWAARIEAEAEPVPQSGQLSLLEG